MELWKKLKKAVNDNLDETVQFVVDTFFLVFWLAICALGVKATAWVRRFFFDDEILTFVAFLCLEALFLITGIILTITYCYRKTKDLVVHILNR